MTKESNLNMFRRVALDDVTEVALGMLRKYGINNRTGANDALFWAWEHAFSYNRYEWGRTYWLAVHQRIKEFSRVRSL